MTESERDARALADAFAAAVAQAVQCEPEAHKRAADMIEAESSMREFCAATAFAAYLRNPLNFVKGR